MKTYKGFIILQIKFGAKEKIYKIKDKTKLNEHGNAETVAEAYTLSEAKIIIDNLINNKG